MNRIQAKLLEGLRELVAFALKRLANPGVATNAIHDSLLKALKATDRLCDEKNAMVRLHRAHKQLKQRLTQTCRMYAKYGCLDCIYDTASKKRSCT